jgi:hypothetical protein
MTDKRRSGGSYRSPPETPYTVPLNPLSQELETLNASLGLLRGLQGIDRRQGHPEQRRREGRRDRLDQDRPGQRR